MKSPYRSKYDPKNYPSKGNTADPIEPYRQGLFYETPKPPKVAGKVEMFSRVGVKLVNANSSWSGRDENGNVTIIGYKKYLNNRVYDWRRDAEWTEGTQRKFGFKEQVKNLQHCKDAKNGIFKMIVCFYDSDKNKSIPISNTILSLRLSQFDPTNGTFVADVIG
jgi:hypothetical protein